MSTASLPEDSPVQALTWLRRMTDTKGVPRAARLVAVVLVRYAPDIRAGQKTLARRSEMSLASVEAGVGWLVANGWLTRVRKGTGGPGHEATTSQFRLRVPEGWAATQPLDKDVRDTDPIPRKPRANPQKNRANPQKTGSQSPVGWGLTESEAEFEAEQHHQSDDDESADREKSGEGQGSAPAAQDQSSSPNPPSSVPGSPSPARSRKARSGPSAEAMEVAREWASDDGILIGCPVNVVQLAGRIDDVALVLDTRPWIIDRAYIWWTDQMGQCRTKGPRSHGIDNPIGYLDKVLPQVVTEYLREARYKAEELGEDPATFDYHKWLLEQLSDAQDQAEESAQEPADSEPVVLVEYSILRNGSDSRSLLVTPGSPDDGGESRWYPEAMAAQLGTVRRIMCRDEMRKMLDRYGWTVEQSKLDPAAA